MIDKLLVAYDGSDESKKAFEMGLEIASKFSAQVIVISVARPPEPPVAVEMEAVLERAAEYYRSGYDAMQESALGYGITPRFEVRMGHPAEQIVLLANEEKAQMIVMGHRGGGSFLQRWRLGSIARRVMNYARCTVVIVR